MNDIKQFKSILKQGISRNTDVLLGCEFLKKLLNIINDYENTKIQLQQKENIINELEKWLEEQHQFIIEIPAYTREIAVEHKTIELCYGNVLDKLQELKGSDKE